MSDTTNRAATVRRFAAALDNDEYAEATSLLAPDATYDTGSAVVEGAAAIVDSFRTTSEMGRARLDALIFSHDIDEQRPNAIVFTDVLRIGNDELRVRNTMHVEFDNDGSIRGLRLESSPGHRERVAEFFKKHDR